MDKEIEKIDQLLEKACYIIDFLPQTISKSSKGQFFEVEYFLLNSDKHYGIRDKFVNIILKLMCYFHVSVLWGGLIDYPKPEVIEQAVTEIMDNHSGTLNVLFPEENALLVFDWDCLNLSVYNPTESMKSLMEKIALSEGLFWRESEC